MSESPEGHGNSQLDASTPAARLDTFGTELAALLNRHSREAGSDTPDFILSQFLIRCLATFDHAVAHREDWYGRTPNPTTKPTIAELEAILACPDAPQITIRPDGSIMTVPTPVPQQSERYTPAKPPVVESDPAKWPTFPGEGMDYRGRIAAEKEAAQQAKLSEQQEGRVADQGEGGDLGEDTHTGGPR